MTKKKALSIILASFLLVFISVMVFIAIAMGIRMDEGCHKTTCEVKEISGNCYIRLPNSSLICSYDKCHGQNTTVCYRIADPCPREECDLPFILTTSSIAIFLLLTMVVVIIYKIIPLYYEVNNKINMMDNELTGAGRSERAGATQ